LPGNLLRRLQSGRYVLLVSLGERLPAGRVFPSTQSLPQIKSVRILFPPKRLKPIDCFADISIARQLFCRDYSSAPNTVLARLIAWSNA
jgi:hypothetical protein